MNGTTDTSAPRPVPQQTILVVEDEILIRMVIADYLRHCGYAVIEASSGDEAVHLLRHREIAVDLVFSDIEMPGKIDGFALSQWVKENRPDLDVLLAGTPSKAADTAADLCESGPLPKPYDSQIVVDRIRRLLAARQK